MSRGRGDDRGTVTCRGGDVCGKTGVPIKRFHHTGSRVRLVSNLSRGGGGVVDGVVVQVTNLVHVRWNDGGCNVVAWAELELK